MDKDGPETMREAVARAIAKGLGDEFDNAFVSKVGWTAAQGQRGGRFRDINEPFQADYLDAADAAIRTVLERLRERELVMRENGMVIHEVRGAPNDVWQAMLDAAVREVG